jgi:hypothetical protein
MQVEVMAQCQRLVTGKNWNDAWHKLAGWLANPMMLSPQSGSHSWSAISKSSYGKAARFVG